MIQNNIANKLQFLTVWLNKFVIPIHHLLLGVFYLLKSLEQLYATMNKKNVACQADFY